MDEMSLEVLFVFDCLSDTSVKVSIYAYLVSIALEHTGKNTLSLTSAIFPDHFKIP